jgi:asparagine N-glycosylation enzyme membrane subunit Stt3
LTFVKFLKRSSQGIINKILLFSPITLIVFPAIYIFIFYNTKPFEDKYFINYISGYLTYYLILGGLISAAAYLKKKVFAGALYIFVLFGQIKAFEDQWKQHINQHPTMGPIFTFYTFIVFGFFIGICLEGFNGARKNIKNMKQ